MCDHYTGVQTRKIQSGYRFLVVPYLRFKDRCALELGLFISYWQNRDKEPCFASLISDLAKHFYTLASGDKVL